VTDFLPAIEASGVFEPDPLLGYVGLGLSAIMGVGSGFYTRMLVGSIELEKYGGVRIKRLTFPLCMVEKDGTVVRRVELAEEGGASDWFALKRHVPLKIDEKSTWLFYATEGDVVDEKGLNRVLGGEATAAAVERLWDENEMEMTDRGNSRRRVSKGRLRKLERNLKRRRGGA